MGFSATPFLWPVFFINNRLGLVTMTSSMRRHPLLKLWGYFVEFLRESWLAPLGILYLPSHGRSWLVVPLLWFVRINDQLRVSIPHPSRRRVEQPRDYPKKTLLQRDAWSMHCVHSSNHSSNHTSHSCHTHTWIFVSYAYVKWFEVWLKSIRLCLYLYLYLYLLFLVSILLLKNNEYHKKIPKNTKKYPKNTPKNTKNREKKENEYHESYVNVCKRPLK